MMDAPIWRLWCDLSAKKKGSSGESVNVVEAWRALQVGERETTVPALPATTTTTLASEEAKAKEQDRERKERKEREEKREERKEKVVGLRRKKARMFACRLFCVAGRRFTC